jgi:hypothetical protein
MYNVFYYGTSSNFRNFETKVEAKNAREAVIKVYSSYMDSNFFPLKNGDILDCEGNLIADKHDVTIAYDGGYFYAMELNKESK